MATLPIIESGRIQYSGIPSATLPTVTASRTEYTGIREAAKYQDTISGVLDKLSGKLFEVAGKEAQEAGMQYVADNSITDEQLAAAKMGDLKPLNLGGKFNIFDQAVRKARSFEISAKFESEARNELAKMLIEIDSGKTTSQDVQAKISTMTEGFSRSLSQIDSEATLKFRATIATIGNTVLNKAYEAEIKRAKTARLIQFDADFDNSMRLLRAEISRGFWIDRKTNKKRSIEELVNVYRNSIQTQALFLGDSATQKTYSDRFEKELRQAKIDAVSEHVTDPAFNADSQAGLDLLRAGQVGNMTDIFRGMSYDDKAKVFANYMIAVDQREKLAKNAADKQKRADVLEFVNLYNQAIGMPDTNPARAGLVSQIANIANRNPDAVPTSVLKDLQKPDTDGNPMVEFNVMNGIYKGTITTAEQIMNAPGLSGKQRVSLLGKLYSEDRRSDMALERGISRLAGIPEIPGQVVILDPKGQQFKARQELKAEAEALQAKAIADGKPLTTQEVLSQLEKNLEARRNTAAAIQAQKNLALYTDKGSTLYADWITPPITTDSVAALMERHKNDKNKMNVLRRIQGLLAQAEGR